MVVMVENLGKKDRVGSQEAESLAGPNAALKMWSEETQGFLNNYLMGFIKLKLFFIITLCYFLSLSFS